MTHEITVDVLKMTEYLAMSDVAYTKYRIATE